MTVNNTTSPKKKTIRIKKKKLSSIEKFFALIKLSRPKFLFYSALLHITGVLLFQVHEKSRDSIKKSYDLWLSILLQTTISVTHLATHFLNEWADYEVDCLNKKDSSWTGGSKVLKNGLLSPKTALSVGILFSMFSFSFGALTCNRYLLLNHQITLLPFFLDPIRYFYKLPVDFVWIGLSVLVVSILYSVKPFRLSALGLGEICVSYVLTFATPAVAFVIQGGSIDEMFLRTILPLFLINVSRMIVMNIPDKNGDMLGGKLTSVVLVGEEKAQMLNNFIYIITFVYIIPNLTLSWPVKVSYLCLIPFRWWLSLYLNIANWWDIPEYINTLPFYESMFVILTVLALNSGLYVSLL